MRTIGIVVFDGAEELDVVGPYEVLTWAASVRRTFGKVFTVAKTYDPVRCAKGMRILPDFATGDAPALDVIVIPGGIGTREQVKDEALLGYVRKEAARCEWVTSVCTGARLLLAAGLANGKRITTHHGAIKELRELGLAAAVLDDVRFVRDGNLITSAGVSAGIDMSLWLVGELEKDPAFARSVQRGIEYAPAPPYTAEV